MHATLRQTMGLLAGLALSGAAGADAFADRFIAFKETQLQIGRTIWVDNCMTCHGYGIAGAPIPTRPKDWAHRLEQDQQTLYSHAIEGFFGPKGTMMPARGDNPALTDDEVKAAVDYMTAVARHHLNLSNPDATQSTETTP